MLVMNIKHAVGKDRRGHIHTKSPAREGMQEINIVENEKEE